jgi:hypothetical protein
MKVLRDKGFRGRRSTSVGADCYIDIGNGEKIAFFSQFIFPHSKDVLSTEEINVLIKEIFSLINKEGFSTKKKYFLNSSVCFNKENEWN